MVQPRHAGKEIHCTFGSFSQQNILDTITSIDAKTKIQCIANPKTHPDLILRYGVIRIYILILQFEGIFPAKSLSAYWLFATTCSAFMRLQPVQVGECFHRVPYTELLAQTYANQCRKTTIPRFELAWLRYSRPIPLLHRYQHWTELFRYGCLSGIWFSPIKPGIQSLPGSLYDELLQYA